MRVLVVGSGGREHAAIWALAKSPRIEKLYCAPGNGGISELAECVSISALDVPGMVAFAKDNAIGLCAVLSDDPQAAGMVDAMEAAGIRCFGCTRAAARIESSKIFSKNLMQKYGIPTAAYATFTEADAALEYLKTQALPIVIKADGLALGKGVVIAQTAEEAEDAIKEMMIGGRFSEAGKSIVIEEFMQGREVTVLAFTDSKTLVTMPPCRDHKRIGDGDTGPNTGGMGVISPPPDYTPELHEQAFRTIFEPTLRAMEAEDCPFKGVIYFGLMLTPDGPKVVEYNARFGDPEAQVVLLLLESDLLEIMEAVIDERLADLVVRFSDKASAIVIAASRGYPGTPDKGYPISGLNALDAGITVFHSGTKLDDKGQYTNAGGRVLGLCTVDETLRGALDSIYANMGRISFEGIQFRKDIGKRELL